jgi:hypothetical protein
MTCDPVPVGSWERSSPYVTSRIQWTNAALHYEFGPRGCLVCADDAVAAGPLRHVETPVGELDELFGGASSTGLQATPKLAVIGTGVSAFATAARRRSAIWLASSYVVSARTTSSSPP